MSNVNITRHDRGLDSKRIEKIIGMISSRVQDIKWDRKDILKEKKDKLKAEVVEKYGLQGHYDAIEKHNKEIKDLEQQIKNIKNLKEPHEIEIAKIMRGNESTYDYNRINDGSPADQYMKERLPDMDKIKEDLSALETEMEEQLWLAKDIEEARGLYNLALSRIEELTKGL